MGRRYVISLEDNVPSNRYDENSESCYIMRSSKVQTKLSQHIALRSKTLARFSSVKATVAAAAAATDVVTCSWPPALT